MRLLGLTALLAIFVSGIPSLGAEIETKAIAKVVQGTIEWLPVGTTRWIPLAPSTELGPGDQVRSGSRSRAVFEASGSRATITLAESSRIEFQKRESTLLLRLLGKGRLYHFLKGRPASVGLEAGDTSAATEGTEFSFALEEDGSSTLALFEGRVRYGNGSGSIELNSGDLGSASPGRPPVRRTAVLMWGDVEAIQWALYYPAILNLDDLGWVPPADENVRRSVEAYRRGNLPMALAEFPADRVPAADEERIYLAALVLAVGGVNEAQELLRNVGADSPHRRLALALQQLVDAVLRRVDRIPPESPNLTATELLAASYAHQAGGDLEQALQSARRAVETAPNFGFGWARRAELEFGFGRIRAAKTLSAHALDLMPENASAMTLMGFLKAAENQVDEALQWFDRAIGTDGSLGNAWLGRGLCQIRQNRLEEGRLSLQMAAALEPQRSLLRSYLGKAFAESRPFVVPALSDKARHELDLAQALDPQDPTPWLYRALLDRNENRINQALRSLDRVQDLAENRGLYRSQMLIDQDRAVASANQASAYRDAGMNDLALRAAGRAVSTDYANASAHQFLAESYAQSSIIGLRYETPRVSEYLIANLLAPVGSGLLSYNLSQQEYSKLFERDGSGVFSQTTYLSRGAWTQSGGVMDTHGSSSVLAEGFYRWDPGYAPNNDLEQSGLNLQLKHQVGPRDTIYGHLQYSELAVGDVALRLDPTVVDPALRVDEQIWPSALAGWHRAWSPEHQTLAMAGWIQGELAAYNLKPIGVVPPPNRTYRSAPRILTAEAQHLWTPPRHTIVAGLRWQSGEFEVQNFERSPGRIRGNQHAKPNFQRLQIYGYETWQVLDSVHLTAGLSYDDVLYPINHAQPPIADGEDRRSRVSPKVGGIWEIFPRTWLRAAYSQSIGGVNLDQSYRLEPTQIAGFNQAFRTLIPESVGETGPASIFETVSVGLESRLSTNTWMTLTLEQLENESSLLLGRGTGNFPVQLHVDRDFVEQSFQATVHQFVGESWSLGARYRVAESSLSRSEEPNVPVTDESRLHSLTLSANLNHRSGLFATFESVWMHQDDGAQIYDVRTGEFVSLPPEDVWQLNVWAGWRFHDRRAELLVGLLNLTDSDYRIHPISLTSPPERERTFVTRLSLHF